MSAEDITYIKLKALQAEADDAHSRWLALYRDPVSLTDTDKRLAMLKAREDYQDAVAEYVFLIKTKKPPKRL